MKTSIQFILLTSIMLVISLSGCSSASKSAPIISTPASKPVAIISTPAPTSMAFIITKPFVMPENDFEISWNIFDSDYNPLGGILTIRKQGSNYTQKLVMPDGSSSITNLTVVYEEDELRLIDRPGNPSGDYMYISDTGALYFCDNQGVIYIVEPLATNVLPVR